MPSDVGFSALSTPVSRSGLASLLELCARGAEDSHRRFQRHLPQRGRLRRAPTTPVIVTFLRSTPRGCTRAIRRAERRLCEGLLPLKAEIQSNPEQLAPPRMQPRSAYSGSGRGSGGMRLFASPQRLCAAFAVESGTSQQRQATEKVSPSAAPRTTNKPQRPQTPTQQRHGTHRFYSGIPCLFHIL